MNRGRERFPVEAAIDCILTLVCRGDLRRQWQKRERSFVHHPVEHHAQGILVSGSPIVLPVGNLRGHITVCARQRATAGFFGDLGNAKVRQLKGAVIGNQYIFRFDVPMDDVFLLARLQCIAQIQPQFEYRFFTVFLTQCLFQWAQKLHPDVYIPAQAALLLDILDVVAGNHVPTVAKLLHQAVLPNQVAHLVLIVGRDAFRAEGVAQHLLDFFPVTGHRQLFQCAPLYSSIREGSLDFIHSTKTALPQLAYDFPSRESDIRIFLVHAGFLHS